MDLVYGEKFADENFKLKVRQSILVDRLISYLLISILAHQAGPPQYAQPVSQIHRASL